MQYAMAFSGYMRATKASIAEMAATNTGIS
jgi:hypothetical protein